MRCFYHLALQQIYILAQTELVWKRTYPDGSPTRFRNLHLWARQAPDLDHPEQECGLVPVQEAMFRGYMEEISLEEAFQADKRLVAYGQRIAAYPSLPQVLTHFPPWSKLYLVECEYTDRHHLFDVYRMEGEHQTLIYLTPLLTPIIPSQEFDGRLRLRVPIATHHEAAGAWLVWAIQVRLWGSVQHAPAYTYEVAC